MPESSLNTSSYPHAICIQDLSLGYGERTILEDVNFCIDPGEIVTILGASGCGKSTLLKGLIGLLKPSHGRIYFFDRQTSGKGSEESLAWARKKIGVLFQSSALIGSLSVAENIALPIQEFSGAPEDIIDDIVRLKLEMVKLNGFGSYYPAELSGGMRKRAGLARAIALDPEILFCDEPTSGLDPVIAGEMDKLLLELNDSLEITMVVITHDLSSIAALSDRSIMIDGQARGIIATGPPDALRDSSDPRVHDFFYRKPAGSTEDNN